MSEKKEYLFIAGENIISLNKDEDGNIISAAVKGEVFDELDDLERFSNFKKYKESKKPLSEFAKDEMVKAYQEHFKQNFENFLILSGAGTSKDIGKDRKGVLISELWNLAEEKFQEGEFNEICEEVKYDVNDRNIETLLTRIQLYQHINQSITFELDGEKKELALSDIVSKIETTIKNNCTLQLPDNSPQKLLLDKVTNRKSSLPRVKVFTTNYDTLFEQAANEINAVVIDGFSFTNPRTFSGRNFDYDIVKRQNSRLSDDKDYIERVFHLYKLHGSIDWSKNEEKIEIDESTDNPLMIYPRSSKYESSYEQPYFEMMSRFQANLRKSNVTLLCIGFSFSDKHIVTAITEALNQNPGFKLIIVDPFCGKESKKKFRNLINDVALKNDKVVIIEDFFNSFAKNIPVIETYDNSQSQDIHVHLDSLQNEN